MAPLSSVDGGLSSRTTRLAFVLTWAAAVVGSVIGGALHLDRPTDVFACAIVLCGTLLITDRRPGALRPWIVALVLAASIASVTLILITATSARENWFLSEAVFVTALLLPRGNTTSGAIGATALIGAILSWGLLAGFPGGDIVETLARPASAAVACVVWRLVIVAILRRHERARRLQDLASAEAIAARSSEDLRRDGIEEITRRAAPLLERIAAGEPLTGALRTSVLVADADIRDLIRFTGAGIDPILNAVTAARLRGATVKLLGDGPEMTQRPSVPLQRTLIDLLDEVTGGSVVLRFPPRHGSAAATLLLTHDGTVERWDLAADGRAALRP